MSRESPTLDELYGVGAEHADDGIEMKSYHLTPEQALEIASNLELAGLDITVWTDGYVEFETKTALQSFANAVLDQVLGAPVGEAVEMPATNGGFTMATFNGNDIPARTKLYAPKEQS